MLGYPPYDRSQAAVYIKRQLVLAEFRVQAMDEYTFFVTWGGFVHEKERKTESCSESVEEFPTLMNLKKAANKYKKNFPR